MLVFAGAVGQFVERHPTMKMLALSFLILIGVMLVAEGLGQHIDKGYIYFAMAFSLRGRAAQPAAAEAGEASRAGGRPAGELRRRAGGPKHGKKTSGGHRPGLPIRTHRHPLPL